jgi:hypothetical protein
MNLFERPVVAGGVPAAHLENEPVRPQSLGGSDFVRLADECFVLATVAPNPEAAIEMVKQGEEYLRLAALEAAPGSDAGPPADTGSI